MHCYEKFTSGESGNDLFLDVSLVPAIGVHSFIDLVAFRLVEEEEEEEEAILS